MADNLMEGLSDIRRVMSGGRWTGEPASIYSAEGPYHSGPMGHDDLGKKKLKKKGRKKNKKKSPSY